MIQVEDRFDAEESRTHHYLPSYTFVPLRKILESHLLTAHLPTIISMPNSGLDAMIDTGRLDDLSRLYRLFMMVPTGLSTLRKAMRDSIVRRGKELATLGSVGGIDAGDDEDVEDIRGKGKARATGGPSQTLQAALKWVQDVLNLKDRFDAIWAESFRGDRDIETGLNEVCYVPFWPNHIVLSAIPKAFETFINLHEKSPEFISLFIDENLKKGLKGVGPRIAIIRIQS